MKGFLFKNDKLTIFFRAWTIVGLNANEIHQDYFFDKYAEFCPINRRSGKSWYELLMEKEEELNSVMPCALVNSTLKFFRLHYSRRNVENPKCIFYVRIPSGQENNPWMPESIKRIVQGRIKKVCYAEKISNFIKVVFFDEGARSKLLGGIFKIPLQIYF